MNIEEAMVVYLNAQAGLAAVAGKIQPAPLPQVPALPQVTYHRIDTVHQTSHSGNTPLDHSRFQLDAWAFTYGSAHAIGEALIVALDSVKGTWGTVIVGLSDVKNAFDQYDPVTGYYRYMIDVIVWWQSA